MAHRGAALGVTAEAELGAAASVPGRDHVGIEAVHILTAERDNPALDYFFEFADGSQAVDRLDRMRHRGIAPVDDLDRVCCGPIEPARAAGGL